MFPLITFILSCIGKTPEEEVARPVPMPMPVPVKNESGQPEFCKGGNGSLVTWGKLLETQEPIGIFSNGCIYKLDEKNYKDILTSKRVGEGFDGNTGNYSYKGYVHSLFGNKDFVLSPHMQVDAIASQQFQYAMSSSEISTVRSGVGVSGKNIQILFLSSNAQFEASEHEVQMQSIVTDKEIGIASGALTSVETIESTQTRFSSDPKKFDATLVERVVGQMNQVISAFEKVLKSDKKPKVINFSGGNSIADIIYDLELLMSKVSVYRQSWNGLFFNSPLPPVSKKEYSLAVGQYVENLLAKDQAFNNAMKKYQSVTEQLAQKKIFIVVSAGNDRYDLATKPFWSFNFLAQSPYVISVAASNSQGTPGNTSDDTMGTFSARGFGSFNPTLAAPGENVLTRTSQGNITVGSGTSQSAPYVSGTLSLMLEANPKLTFEQAKEILVETAHDLPSYSSEADGAGVVDAVAAVTKARSKAR